MTVLVTGATGKVGSRVLAQLLADGRAARAGTRRSDIPLDWSTPATWTPALSGVDALFLVLPGGDDGHRSVAGIGDHAQAFLEAASQAGVRRVVLMTALGMNYAPSEVDQRAVELRLQESDFEWSIVRPNWFHQNFTEGPLRDLAVANHGVLRIPAGEAAVSFIDANDIAAVSVTALRGTHGNREYDVTGEEALTFTQAAAITARAGLPVTAYESVSDEEFRRSATALGWHPEYVDTLSGLYAVIASGANAHTTPDATDLLGRPLRTLAEYAAAPGA